ncbi:MAG: radical SAM/SPASM domain-containing protein [Planctomycetota bacterium]
MSKLALFRFLARPGEIVRGVRRLGGRGAMLHGLRRAGASMEWAVLGPAQLRINPMGTVCNHTCSMCWLAQLTPEEKQEQQQIDREQGMSLEQYLALLDGMPPGLTEVNVVGGGEPLVHPDCIEIMAEIKRRRLSGYLMTNGSLMKESVARAMVDMSWDLTRISTHAGDRDTYRLIHGVDHFERVRNNLLAFDRIRREKGRGVRCKIHTHYVLQRENIDTIPAMFRFAEEISADHIVFEIVFPFSAAVLLSPAELKRGIALLRESAEGARVSSNAVEIVHLMERELRESAPSAPPEVAAPAPPEAVASAPQKEAPCKSPAAASLGNNGSARAMPPPAIPAFYRPANRCSVGFDSSFITALGDVLPCCFADEVMGNVKEQSFREIWHGPKYTAFRKRLINGRFTGYCSRFRCKLTSFLHD